MNVASLSTVHCKPGKLSKRQTQGFDFDTESLHFHLQTRAPREFNLLLQTGNFDIFRSVLEVTIGWRQFSDRLLQQCSPMNRASVSGLLFGLLGLRPSRNFLEARLLGQQETLLDTVSACHCTRLWALGCQPGPCRYFQSD